MSTRSTYPASTYPVQVSAVLDQPSRGLWLVKWLLAIPHYVVLAFLWLGFAVTWILAFFAILVTGRYPRALFAYNVGVLRWSWRVGYYSYSALGTDQYPPFTLDDVPSYPAHLSVDYPERLSRGLVLVKWWLLAIPHYIIVGFFVGGGAWFTSRSNENWQWSWGSGGLVGILVLVSAVILLFTGSYPRSLYDFILGMNRWVLRVVGYAALMTDVYPPFRLDLGGDDPDAVALEPGAERATAAGSWSAGRVVALIVGAVVAFAGMGLAIGGLGLTVADHVSRDRQGYLTSPAERFSTGGYAITSDQVQLEPGGPAWALPSRVLGTVRVRVTPADASRPVFLAVGRTDDVARYLGGTRYATPRTIGGQGVTYTEHGGGPPATPPTSQTFWTKSVTGTGRQTLTWEATAGAWTLVVMNADASAGVDVTADVAATAPAITWIGVALLIAGVLGLAVGAVVIALAIRSASRDRTPRPAATRVR